MDDLTAFIAARLDEDEAIANAAWYEKDRLTYKEVPREQNAHWDASDIGMVGPRGPAHHIAAHVARHDPARVLREAAAKRAILAGHHPELVEVINADQDERSGDFCAGCDEEWPCLTMNAIATVWSDHPDYRAGWAE